MICRNQEIEAGQMMNTRSALRRFGGVLGALVLCGTGLTAAEKPMGSSILPQFVFGGGWYTALYFSNMTGGTVSFPVYFYSDSGAALSVPSLGTSKDVTIAAYGTAVIEAPDSGSLSQGYATFTLPAGVGGYGVFRQAVSGAGPQEAVVPFASTSATTATVTFDEIGLVTAMAVANPSASMATVKLTALGEDGSTLGWGNLTLDPYTHTASTLAGITGMGGISGHRGTVQLAASTGNVATLGLRFNGSALTSIPLTTAISTGTATASFQPGKYQCPSTVVSDCYVEVVGPGVASDGATLWTLRTTAAASRYTYPEMAVWYVGSATKSPLAARLAKVGITSAAWSYGIGDADYSWGGNDLLGFSQVGNTLTIARFTKNGTDSASPVDQITFTLTSTNSAAGTALSAFQAGQYSASSTVLTDGLITIAGPGISSDGVTQWTLSASSGASRYTYPLSAAFYVGALTKNPYADRLKKAGITTTEMSFGVGNANYSWASNDLLGFSQIGDTLTIWRFTRNGTDYGVPQDHITYKVVQ
jgi:hypothetical protein